MILVTILLLVIMGPTTIVGMACLVLMVPLVQFIATRMLRVRRKRVEMTDKRVEMVNFMLQGVSNFHSEAKRFFVLPFDIQLTQCFSLVSRLK